MFFSRMYDASAALTDQELNEVERYPWIAGYRLADLIKGSFGHVHEEHEPILRERLTRSSSSCVGGTCPSTKALHRYNDFSSGMSCFKIPDSFGNLT
jgi:hypothetical protein